MDGITAKKIAKIAEWVGLEDVQAAAINVTYRPWPKLSNRIRFNPIEDPADAWRVLEHVTAAGLRYVEMCTEEVDIFNNCTGENLAHGHGENQREALCAAVLEMIDEDEL